MVNRETLEVLENHLDGAYSAISDVGDALLEAGERGVNIRAQFVVPMFEALAKCKQNFGELWIFALEYPAA